MPKRTQQIAAFVFGVVFVVTILILAVLFPTPTRFQYTVFKTVLALAAAGVAGMIPGFLNIQLGGWLRAGGALAVFVLVYRFNPAILVAEAPSSNSTRFTIRMKASPELRETLYSSWKAGQAGFRLDAEHRGPFDAEGITRTQFGLDAKFMLPPLVWNTDLGLYVAFRDTPVSCAPSKIAVQDESSETELSKSSQPTLNPQAISGGAQNLIDGIEGIYRSYPGSRTNWTGGTLCTGATDWRPEGPYPDNEGVVIVTKQEDGDYLIKMENVGGRQLPKLPYTLKVEHADDRKVVLAGRDSEGGWQIDCGTGTRTVDAASTGNIRFESNSGVITLTGTLMYTASTPSCNPQYCPTTYRDIYTFDERKD